MVRFQTDVIMFNVYSEINRECINEVGWIIR
uniref:Uncharacterized protein n=1 Tax=Siphoviridae sp. ctXZx16 TaxID=2826371 RepID=A0A8S5ML16_9CAUD|nr:MAG TPA: hypothetical protein [Siphoviridae sp. ctXZx16]DAJ60529.1 MAG TPA: hypothetical protein [Caudoviricetes sp.]DAO32128.1 MAG TPA: hypothetical protein [Caudoviricetes sp.]